MPKDDLDHLEEQREWDEAQSTIAVANESDVILPIEFKVEAAEKQYGIWEMRIRFADKNKQEKERQERENMHVSASSSTPDGGDVEMSAPLPLVIVKKRSIIEPKAVTLTVINDPPCAGCKKAMGKPPCESVLGMRCGRCGNMQIACPLLMKKKLAEVLDIGDDEDVDDDVTVAKEPTTQSCSGRKAKGKAKEVAASLSTSSVVSEQHLRELEAKVMGIAGAMWDHAKQLRQLREVSYPPE
ncbi:hypothetical protein K503DRAFT_803712 [Rhizopogon vinicolor AM-OR11-026]|uniref:Uncharacterized protein n=1 Tax=Rhizopogon vinicolor AM-OR11-026 TaxID=1314800 RepID=A0A1B7MNW8_9AGAM|nr:hypothetical protein K503DRAFT_803712 [Rhizopogon vinicolor AM-OR11-026]